MEARAARRAESENVPEGKQEDRSDHGQESTPARLGGGAPGAAQGKRGRGVSLAKTGGPRRPAGANLAKNWSRDGGHQ
ncbi:hypothetical protein ZEAMMB73_Zm00001d035815 [Zea mays]|jgi:hypothetical protein|uniref:Uncharacterized protein n=1 Tax=Zea mays TaxID=4577 RepID=A0A1D6LIW8_MAIZE|nr:hypothetical protein ZEAMMB73_Zm00001d035815 [Zea mays]